MRARTHPALFADINGAVRRSVSVRHSSGRKKTTTLLFQHEDYLAHGGGAVQRPAWRSDLLSRELNDDALYD